MSVDDMEGPEWNHTALSPKKRELAETLLRRLAARFASGGFLHTGQGKWYPGEPLPRWAIGVWWRGRAAAWGDPTLVADTRVPGSADLAVAQRFVTGLAGRLGLDASRDHRVRGCAEAPCRPRRRFPPTSTRCWPISARPTSVPVSPGSCCRDSIDRQGSCCRCARPTSRRRCARLAQQPVAFEARTTLCASGGFTHRPQVAARIAAGRPARRYRAGYPGRSLRAARRASRGGSAREAQGEARRDAVSAGAEGRDQDGVVRRSAQRPSQRVHAAADAPRGLCRAPRPPRGRGGGMQAAGRDRGLHAAARSARPGSTSRRILVSSRSTCIPRRHGTTSAR